MKTINWQRVTQNQRYIHSYSAEGSFTWRGKECELRVEDTKIYENGGHERWYARIWWGTNEYGGFENDKQHVFMFKTLREGKQFLEYLVSEKYDKCQEMLVERALKLKDPAGDLQLRDFCENILAIDYVPSDYGLKQEGRSMSPVAEGGGCLGSVLITVICFLFIAIFAL